MQAQSNGDDIPSPEKYLFPIKPSQQNFLTGTMGELRNTHFHTGIDIRTEGRIGLPVMAAQNGYISRITMSAAGYGNAVYIQHPNGHTSVYAHLDKLNGNLATYVLQEQYRRKTFEINLYFRQGQFNVNRGDTIAFSGNSGSSGGPHLHFDIRDSRNDLLNPLYFGFSEIEDRVPPVAEKIALVTMNIDSRVNDRFGRFEFYVQKIADGSYIIQNPIPVNGGIGIELLAHDKLSYSHYRCGINYLEMHVDDQLVYSKAIDKLAFAEQRNVLAHMNYHVLKTQNSRYHKLYIDDGNALRFYKTNANKGLITVAAGEEKKIELIMRDAYGNKTLLRFKLQGANISPEVIGMASINKPEYKIQENTLIITSPGCGEEYEPHVSIYHKGNVQTLNENLFGKGGKVYLFDLRTLLPDSINVCGTVFKTNLRALVPSTSDYKFFSERIDLQFSKNALFDTLYLSTHYQTTAENLELFSFGDPLQALFKNVQVSLKPSLSYNKDKTTSVYKAEGKYFSYVGGDWQNDRITFNTRDFGTYTILKDSLAPSIERIRLNGTEARFKIKDDLSGIAKFEATINGQWLLMHYDYKINTIWSEKLDKSKPLKGEFILKVSDNAGNQKIFTQTLE